MLGATDSISSSPPPSSISRPVTECYTKFFFSENLKVLTLAETSDLPSSATKFPPHQSSSFTLINAGIRCLLGQCWIEKMRAYAMGLYVDEKGFQNLVQTIAPEEKSSLKFSKFQASYNSKPDHTSFERLLLNSYFDKSMRLVFARDMAATQMASAYRKQVGQRISDVLKNKENELKVAKEELEKFALAIEKLGTIKRESEFIFTWTKENWLFVTADGKLVYTLNNKPIAWAVFDTYLGRECISENAKKLFEPSWLEFVKKNLQ